MQDEANQLYTWYSKLFTCKPAIIVITDLLNITHFLVYSHFYNCGKCDRNENV